MQPGALVRFADRRSAYAFVAELRRLGDLDELSRLRVHAPPEADLVVEVPPQTAPVPAPVVELAERFGGHLAATGEERERLRAAVQAARLTVRESSERLGHASTTVGRASNAVESSRGDRARRAAAASGQEPPRDPRP